MPRPKSDNPKAVLTVRLEPDLIARIERLADRAGVTKSVMAGKVIRAGLARGPAPEKPPAVAPEPDEKAAWVKHRVRQLCAQGRTTPVAVREAKREWDERAR